MGRSKMNKLFVFYGIVRKVVDGDTVILDIDRGWHDFKMKQRCRIYDIDAKELYSGPATPRERNPLGYAALEYAAQLLPQDSEVVVRSHKLDQYGRPLVTILKSDGTDFSEAMVAAGHATWRQVK